MILIDCDQGTPEWFAARLGVITASKAKDACDKLKTTGKPSKVALAYAAQLAMERVSGQPCDDTFQNFAMRRGSELEPKARFAYEEHTGQLVRESGLVLTDDRLFGYSTDGLIGDDGLIEIKCPMSALTVVSMWRDADLSDYEHQIQMGLWLTGRQWLDFVMFDPRLDAVGKSLFIQHVERDEEFIAAMEADLMRFAALVADFESHLRKEAA
jgi:hypothetical protein